MPNPAPPHVAPPTRSADEGPEPERRSERRSAAALAWGPCLRAVREGWRRAWEAHDPEHPAFCRALAAYAQDGRARAVPIGALLRALDALVRPAEGGQAALDFGRARERAGTLLIRSYYRSDIRAD
jgi:hypothetical protein